MWQRRILLWADARRSLLVAATAAAAVLVAAVALALAAMQSPQPRARSSREHAEASPHRPSAAGPAVTSTAVALLRSSGCRKDPRDVSAATSAAGRLLVEFMAYSLRRLGPRPSFPDATVSFQQAIWGMPHSPPPALAAAPVTVTRTGAELTAPGIAVARFSVRIERPGLTAFPMLVAVSLRGCRWLAGGF
jgi:hypothetical protein